ncbi:MAG: ATP-grasp domain-containing protein, partial [Clostridia bacterium]|nr:ATP-grasp domain-containing protein [Clostridia bacterium]
VFNNSDVIENANDKRLTYMRAASAGLPIMDTYYSFNDASILGEFPLVVKSAHGCGGRNVMLAHNEFELKTAIDRIAPDAPVIQKLAGDIGKDLRVYFVGNEIVCAMLRQSNSDFRSNYGLGGSAVLHELTDEEREIALKAASMFDLGYAGVDFIFDNGKLIFNEVEDAVGARMIYANTDIDIVDIYVDYIYRKVSETN